MQNNTQAGKGDKPRPVKKSVYNDNYDDINWGHTVKKSKLVVNQKSRFKKISKNTKK